MFITDKTNKDITELYKQFEDEIEYYNSEHTVTLSIALGFDQFRSEDNDTIMKMITRADAMMYENKKKYKKMTTCENNVINLNRKLPL